MTKQDKLLIYRGEMISEIADDGVLGVETMEEFKLFMLQNFAKTTEMQKCIYIDVLNNIAISGVVGEGLSTSVSNMLEVFEMSQDLQNILTVIESVKDMNNVSYADSGEIIALLKQTTSGIPHLDLTRARVLLNVAIAQNIVEDIKIYTAVLTEISDVVQAQRESLTWESQDV